MTAAQAAETIVVPWNDPVAVEAAVGEHQPAAILAEAVPANMGLVPPDDGFLATLRDLASSSGALLVLDEVISGFRVARGGAQEAHEVAADLTIMGKVLGGGLPAAAYGGRRELMERVAPAGDVYQAGTLSGNPLAVAAGLATLRRLDRKAYERLEDLTQRLAAGLRAAAGERPVQIASVCGLVTPFFSAEAGSRLRGGIGLRPRRLWALLPRPARRGASIRLRRSSRLGSFRLRTTRRRSTAPPRRPRRPSPRRSPRRQAAESGT